MIMLCSICSEGFDPPSDVCPVCGCALVPSNLASNSSNELPSRLSLANAKGNLVELCRPGSYPLALMVKQTLEQNGIPAFIPGGNSLSIMPHLAFGGELRVLVPEQDIDAARDVYQAYFEGSELPEENSEEE